MLESLIIRNFALIEDLSIDFGRGFNVLSGETGAGKSIIIGALGLILGGKSSSEMVRTGTDMASIEGLFSVSPDSAAVTMLAGAGIDTPSGELVIRRTVSADGKSRCFINGVLSNMTVLSELGALLVDIHGQHENQSLLKISLHLGMLDEFAGLAGSVDGMRGLVRELARLEEQLSALAMDDREKARRLDLNTHAIREIDAAGLRENEEAELEEENRLLSNFEKIHGAVESACETLARPPGRSVPQRLDWNPRVNMIRVWPGLPSVSGMPRYALDDITTNSGPGVDGSIFHPNGWRRSMSGSPDPDPQAEIRGGYP